MFQAKLISGLTKKRVQGPVVRLIATDRLLMKVWPVARLAGLGMAEMRPVIVMT